MSIPDPAERIVLEPVERVVVAETDDCVYLEHLGRYEFATQFVDGRNVLDVACGAGYGAPILRTAGAKTYTGVDISRDAIAMAERRYGVADNISFVQADACGVWPIDDGSVDVAVSFETIEHLVEPRKFLGNLRRAVRPGGQLIISTPNRTLANPGEGVNSRPKNPFHIREWNVREFRKLLSGFFTLEKILGQAPRPFSEVAYGAAAAVLVRHAERRAALRMLRELYRRVKRQRPTAPLVPTSADDRGSVPVQVIRRWECPAYVVCVCKRSR